jgi:hypothetical protein
MTIGIHRVAKVTSVISGSPRARVGKEITAEKKAILKANQNLRRAYLTSNVGNYFLSCVNNS